MGTIERRADMSMAEACTHGNKAQDMMRDRGQDRRMERKEGRQMEGGREVKFERKDGRRQKGRARTYVVRVG